GVSTFLGVVSGAGAGGDAVPPFVGAGGAGWTAGCEAAGAGAGGGVAGTCEGCAGCVGGALWAAGADVGGVDVAAAGGVGAGGCGCCSWALAPRVTRLAVMSSDRTTTYDAGHVVGMMNLIYVAPLWEDSAASYMRCA